MAGTNYGGGGWQAGCGVRCFEGMGERWKINGRRRGGCGPGMPGPYRVALFVRRGGFHIRPQACAAAEGLRIAAVGGGVHDAPRR